MNSGFQRDPPLSRRNAGFVGPAFLLVLSLLAFAPPARALVIIPIWDSSITNDPNAAAIENTINMAIQFYEARFADPITVSIQFVEMSGGLGESEFNYYNIPYTQFITNLQNDATTTNDAIALAHLPAGPNNPVTGDANINVNVANIEALGITGFASPGDVVGSVYLNTSIMNLTRTSIDPSKFDLQSVAEHEMDEVLALGSILPEVPGDPYYDPFPQDLFRYTSTGARTLTTANGFDDAWFSLDGTTLLVQFNQNQGDRSGAGGDYGDWWSPGGQTPRVQDAFATPGATPEMGVELIALDVQGYDLLPPPQPGITGIALSATNLILNGTNGLATGIYHLLASTNVALSLNQWSSVATNVLTANGNFTITATNVVNPQSPGQFYILQLQ